MKVIANLKPGNVPTDEFVTAIQALIAEKGWEIPLEYVVPKLSKSEKIVIEAGEIATSGVFINRNDLAARVDCTVSLISATFKENADNQGVIEYLAMEKEFRAAKKAQTQYANMLKTIQAMQREGLDIAALGLANVIQLPVTIDQEAVIEATPQSEVLEITATEESADLSPSSASEETSEKEVVSITSAPKRSRRASS